MPALLGEYLSHVEGKNAPSLEVGLRSGLSVLPAVKSQFLCLFWLTCFSLCMVLVSAATDVVTYHNDIARTGQNQRETTLTYSNVDSSSFGKLFTLPVDGVIDAEPLYLSAVA